MSLSQSSDRGGFYTSNNSAVDPTATRPHTVYLLLFLLLTKHGINLLVIIGQVLIDEHLIGADILAFEVETLQMDSITNVTTSKAHKNSTFTQCTTTLINHPTSSLF
jgi:hypothetical protein